MRRGPAIVASLLVALALAGPAPADTRSRDLRVATTTKIRTLNPLAGQLPAEYRVWALNYDLLVAFDRTTMLPDTRHSLATRVDVSRDQLTYTYHLKPGLKWSDGVPLTAHDVVWTMEYMTRWSAPNSIEAVKDWKAKDDTTVVARLRHRSVEMKSLWIYILPEHVWKAADTQDWERFHPPLPLVGSGPYTVTSWNQDGTTVMQRNRFFRRASSNTGPERVLVTYYRTRDRAVRDIEQNRLDVLPSGTLDVQNAQLLQRTNGVRVFRSPPLGLEYWVFNLAPRVSSRVHKSVVQDQAIRTALAWAIDRSALVRDALSGYGAPGNTQLSRSYGAFSVDLSADPQLGYHYDPAKARSILEKAGWHVGRGGVREKNAVRAEFELAYDGREPTERRAVARLRTWAREVGIQIDVRVHATKRLISLEFNKAGGKLAPAFDTEIWSIRGDPTPEFLLSLFTKAQIGVWNDSGFVDKRYEELYKAALSARSEGTREANIHTLQRIAARKLPYIELYEADAISAVNTRTWTNWTTQPSPAGQPLTEYGYETIIALRPGRLASASYPGVPWALAALGALAAVALGSSVLAHRREQREPIELPEAARDEAPEEVPA
ncbi:MAG: peptide/nickel transport system substrate-binding protein [Gaiellales bacterium]|nr:peptide/nickel transport system substrate-binding protein [Gaiellales bacterium]